jgi:hypothetical protein
MDSPVGEWHIEALHRIERLRHEILSASQVLFRDSESGVRFKG